MSVATSRGTTAGTSAPGHPGAETAGKRAERLVYERLRAALPDEYRLYPNVHWLGRTGRGRAIRDGEADLVLAHPERGLLVWEVKAGEISRDVNGNWWAGRDLIEPSPFKQASDSLYVLLDELRALPDAPPRWDPIAGHATAFPDVDLASAGTRLRLLGPDVEPTLVFDRAKLPPTDADGAVATTRRAVDAALDLWTTDEAGRPARREPPGSHGMRLVDALLSTPVELHSILRSEIDEGEREVVRLTEGQTSILRGLRRVRRAEIRGGAGTGKTMLALEKARELARQGWNTLLVCFNQPLVRMLLRELETGDEREREYLRVWTFHQLCEDLGREAGTLPERPVPIPQAWWNETLPNALLEAIDKLPTCRFHAIVVDEGQDFEVDWYAALDLLLETPADDVLYVFHDPAQTLYRERDVVDKLGLQSHDLTFNCRNARPIHDLVARLSMGGLEVDALRTDGREPEIIAAETPAETIDALRGVLHRLRHDEGVRPWEIVVLTGRSLEKSDVWAHRRFGNEVLWNGQVDDAGRPLGLRADAVPSEPSDVIPMDTIRRFKGLDREVVILVELDPADPRLERLLYVGISRARQHVVVIASAAVTSRMSVVPHS